MIPSNAPLPDDDIDLAAALARDILPADAVSAPSADAEITPFLSFVMDTDASVTDIPSDPRKAAMDILDQTKNAS